MDVTDDQIIVFRAFMFKYQYRLGVMSRTMKIRVWKDTCWRLRPCLLARSLGGF